MLKALEKLRTIKSKITSYAGDYHYYYFSLILLVISFKYPIIFILLIAYLLYLKRRINFKFLTLLFVILALAFLTKYLIIKKTPTHILGKCQVVEVKDKEAVIKKGYYKYIIKGNFEEGEVIYLEAVVEKFPTNNTLNGFNQNEYYLTLNIYGKIDNYKIIDRVQKNHFGLIREKIKQYINQFKSPTKDYLTSLILGDSSFISGEKALLSNLGIAYLLGLSGIHLFLIINFIKKILFHLDIKDNYQIVIIGIIYLIFLYLTRSKFVVKRLFLLYILNVFNQSLRLQLTKLDIISILFFLIVIFNPSIIYSFGFKISFLITTFITLASFNLKSRSKLLTSYKYFIAIYLVSIPLQISFNNEVNLIIFLVSPLLVILFKYLIIPLVLLTFIFPIINSFTDLILNFIYQILSIFNTPFLKLSLPDFSIVQTIIYLFLLFLLFRKGNLAFKMRKLLTFLLFVVLISLDNNFDPRFKVIFLDVYQGDTTIISSPFNGETIVIDAYGSILDTLKSLNLVKIDYLILSHEDEDHTKEAQNLIDNLNVKKVIINPYGNYKLNHPKIIKYQANDYLSLKYIDIEFFGPIKNYYDNNDNSLVFKVNYQKTSFLFTGDISKIAELDLVLKYGNKLKSNYLKVPHHGSKTSSSQLFLEMVDPDYAVMFYAKNNRYGFPNDEVINRYKSNNIALYQTAWDQTLIYDSSSNKINTLYSYQKKI